MNVATATACRFQIRVVEDLSRLAWCACIDKGSREARLQCGDLVEASRDAFAAGAWSGDYTSGKPDQAETMAGSAGRAVDDGFIFSAASHTLEWLHYVHVNDCLYVSNSMPFLLAATSDEPDLNYPDYYFDILETYRAGLSRPTRALPTAGGRAVGLVVGRNLRVGADLSVSLEDKPVPSPPTCFEDYRTYLHQAIERIVKNAADPARQHAFNPLVTVSTGYDSVAVAALAAKVGCTDAVTFVNSGGPHGWGYDSGRAIGEALGFEVTEYNRENVHLLDDLDNSEFCVKPFNGSEKYYLLFRQKLEGTVFITGALGENYWSLQCGSCQPLLREPNAIKMSHIALTEMALRLGFIHFPAPSCGAVHAPSLARISRTGEMKPWRIGGYYDRPIPRRIAEDAGVPRKSFGMKERGGPGMQNDDGITAENCEDLQAFLHTTLRSHRTNGHPQWWQRKFRAILHRTSLWLRGGGRLQLRLAELFVNRFHPDWRTERAYYIHWAWIRTMERYKTSR